MIANKPTTAADAVSQSLSKRNRNPGNLRPSPSFTWKGQIDINKNFVVFDSEESGVRAAFINLRSYFKNNFNTVEKIVNRWAPPSDNNPTNAYVDFVSQRTGFDKNQVLDFNPTTAKKILNAIFEFESGEKFSQSTLDAGIALV